MNDQNINSIIKKIEEVKTELHSHITPECETLVKSVSSKLLDVITEQTIKFAESIQERKKVENELKLFSRASEQSANSIVITNTNGDIIYVNKKFCESTGYTKEEAIGKNPRILKSGNQDEKFYKNMWETLSGGKVWSGEFHNKRKDGSLIWEHAVITPVKNEDGIITHYIAVKEDITEKKLALEELEKHKKLLEEEIEVKNKFFSIISHDLRSPFTALLGYAEILDEDYDDLTEEEVREYISSLRKTAKSTLNLLESLLTWARAQSGRIDFDPKEYNLSEIVIEIVNLYKGACERKNITLINEIQPGVTVFCDREMILTILRNFVSNAIKFTFPGGEIKIKYSCDTDFHFISVEDNGIGISEEYKEKIFNLGARFSMPGTNDEEGTGFGLVLVSELVKWHHGKISVISEPGKGSEFIIHIPKNLKQILDKK